MNRMYVRLAGLFTVGAVMLVTSGCQYHWGQVMHPQISSLAVGHFENATTESAAAGLLRGSLTETISTQAGVSLQSPARADAIVEGRIVSIRQTRLARAKVRDESVTQDDADEFQTVLYRVEATVEYRVRLAATERLLVESRRVVGEADMSRWPDQDVVRQAAIGHALDDAAKRMISTVTEAW